MATVRMVKKIALLGDTAVGKSSLVRRFVLNEFSDSYIETIGAKVSRREVTLPLPGGDTWEINMIVWDIVGHKDPRRVPNTYYKGVAGVVVVCDTTRFATFAELDFWVAKVQGIAGKVPFAFLANKCDLPNREVTEENLAGLSRTFRFPHFFTSAKTGENVAEAFNALARLVAAPDIAASNPPKT